MRKYLVACVCLLAFGTGKAQYSLTFCEDVTKEGKPVMVSNQFMVDAEGGVMKFLLRTDNYFNADQLDFRIYYVGESGLDEEIVRLPQTVQSDWSFAWKEVVMFDPGLYRVKVFTAKGTYLTSANLNIKHR